MKKLIVGSLLLFVLSFYWIKSFAANLYNFPQNWEPIQVSSTATPANLGTPLQIPLQASNQSNVGLRACLVRLMWSGDAFPAAGTTISVLDNSTTAYTITVTTFTSGPYSMSWEPQYPLCLGFNTTGYVQVSTGNFKVNAYGFRRDF